MFSVCNSIDLIAISARFSIILSVIYIYSIKTGNIEWQSLGCSLERNNKLIKASSISPYSIFTLAFDNFTFSIIIII